MPIVSALALMATAALQTAAAQQTPLWTGPAPGVKGAGPGDIPSYTLYRALAATANGAAVVVCPGGGYGMLAEHEGRPVAQWLNTLGITAIVLKYRLGPRYHHPVELGDAQRVIRTVRAHAAEWAVDLHRVGILGFSAGGHLASTAATHFDNGDAGSADPVERFSSRPDFAILIYPVITMLEPYTHMGSRENLLGDHPPEALLELLSNERQVTQRTPPCFLVHTADDPVVPVENSLEFAEACHKAGVPVELHIFTHGPHGFGLGGNDPVLASWPKLCARWLRAAGITP
ncbi:MAG TPA: alpha/beta hydrolase [Chthonomonadales bacterium]|nr:alpha/beta hydrolase [Chthonomonadales bacterium]